MTLANVAVGTNTRVTAIRGRGEVTRRLMEMGIIPGVEVKVVKEAPFGDPIEIRLLGYNLAIRKNEAEAIEVNG